MVYLVLHLLIYYYICLSHTLSFFKQLFIYLMCTATHPPFKKKHLPLSGYFVPSNQTEYPIVYLFTHVWVCVEISNSRLPRKTVSFSINSTRFSLAYTIVTFPSETEGSCAQEGRPLSRRERG